MKVLCSSNVAEHGLLTKYVIDGPLFYLADGILAAPLASTRSFTRFTWLYQAQRLRPNAIITTAPTNLNRSLLDVTLGYIAAGQ